MTGAGAARRPRPPRFRARRLLLAGAAPALAASLLAACGDNVGAGACIEDGPLYSFVLGGDTTLVFRWPRGRQPVRVYAEPAGELPQAVSAAVEKWIAALRCRELSATLIGDSATADIIIRNPQSAPALHGAFRLAADSVGACGGVTPFYYDSTLTLLGPLRISLYPLGTDSVALAGCYRMVALHELGHAFGILSHSPDPDDLMASQPRRGTLSQRDRVTFQYLHHTTPTIRPHPR